MVTRVFNPCTGKVQTDSGFEASLVHPLRFGTARATKADPVSKKVWGGVERRLDH